MQWPQHLAAQPESSATDADIEAFVASVFAPLSDDEIIDLRAEHKAAVGDGCFDPPFEPSAWHLPHRALPDSYLAFLRYSNGGFFAGQNRDLDPLFNIREIRDYMLRYSIPHWMPMSCPIGFDGGGTFYLLDMRYDSINDDYPVLFAHAGNLGYDDAVTLANSFTELIDTQLGQT
jgi:hypothetical protein